MSTPENLYSGARIDRVHTLRRDAAWLARRLDDAATRVLPLWRAKNFIAEGDPPAAAWVDPAAARALLPAGTAPILLGVDDGIAYFAADLSHLDEATVGGALAGGAFTDLRAVGALLPGSESALLAYARGITHWHRRHLYCGACGTATEPAEGGHLRRCGNSDCALDHFPRTDPAVIMLVTRSDAAGDWCLLGRRAGWPAGMASTLAGFVEPGESLEESVRREVMEEAAIVIGGVHYHSSQPWPFPGQIMLGFHAEAESSAITIDPQELEFADWYRRDALIEGSAGIRLPRRDSIARRLVEDWLAQG